MLRVFKPTAGPRWPLPRPSITSRHGKYYFPVRVNSKDPGQGQAKNIRDVSILLAKIPMHGCETVRAFKSIPCLQVCFLQVLERITVLIRHIIQALPWQLHERSARRHWLENNAGKTVNLVMLMSFETGEGLHCSNGVPSKGAMFL